MICPVDGFDAKKAKKCDVCGSALPLPVDAKLPEQDVVAVPVVTPADGEQ